jgi:hypothetical protein
MANTKHFLWWIWINVDLNYCCIQHFFLFLSFLTGKNYSTEGA